ncbi:MAG: phage major tail protein, TP901-1 family [Rhizomicrobium sp.]
MTIYLKEKWNMTAQRGKDLLIKIGDGGDPENFTTVAGLRATSLDFNATTIDITNSDSADMWRELLADGVKSATVAGSGVFKDAASDAALKTAFFNQALNDYQIVIPSFGTVTGPFKLTSLQYDGPYDGELKISLSLASAGVLSFAAA